MAKNNDSAPVKVYSGEEYFKGLMFGQGEVGEIISSQISDDELTKKAKSKEGEKAAAAIVEYIEEVDPTYFDELKSSIENKDPNKLVETLAEGEKLIVSYAEDSGNKTEVLTEEDVVTPQACGPTVCVLVVVAGVYLYVGGVQGVVLQTGAAITTGIWKYVAYTSSSVQQAYAIEQAAVETLDMLTEQSGK
ncbi:sporulation delaying protein family toxin [Ureibacillus sp. Re31]|uniref:Sporulation delaying protein family toxin n=1 Tax=Ureibacillus galli TaxID=2762222 RepID=A0ABR8XE80_9BACL|nr:sporulation delaying protein family toxin [Ureibacillus galli]